MGIINVEGLGQVQIQGDTPTENELNAISEEIKTLPKSDVQVQKATDDFLSGPKMARLVLEVGLGIGATFLSGGAALPLLATTRAGMLARPFLMQLGKSSLASGGGSGTGALISQTFDPTDDAVKDVVRAATTGALAEGVGGPITIKGLQFVKKALGPKGVPGVTKMYAGSDEAERVLTQQAEKKKGLVKLLPGAEDAEKTLATQAEKILANPNQYTPDVIEAARKSTNPMLTLGVKADNRFIDIAENITEKSLFGVSKLAAKKEGARQLATASVDDFAKQYTTVDNKTDLGLLFNQTLTKSQELFDQAAGTYYSKVDDLLKSQGVATRPIIDLTPMKGELNKLLKEVPLGRTQKATRDLINDNLDQIKKMGGKATFTQANNLRSDILALGRSLTARDSAKFKFAQKTIADQITKALRTEAVPDAVKEAAATANAFYREGLETFNDKIMGNILKKNPDDIFRMIVARGDKPYTIRTTMDTMNKLTKLKNADGKALLTTDEVGTLKTSLKGHFLGEMLSKARTQSQQYGSFFDANKLNKFIGDNQGTLKELFDGSLGGAGKKATGELGELSKAIDALSFAQGKLSREGGLPGGVFIQLSQASAAGTVFFYGDSTPGAVGILLGPAVISRMLLNPRFNKTLIEGFGSPTLPKAGFKTRALFNRMVAEGLIDKETFDGFEKEMQKVERGEQSGEMFVPKTNRAKTLDLTTPVAPGNLEEVAPEQLTQQPAGQPIPSTPQQQIAPAPTRLPPMPAAPTSAAPATQDRGTQYQGLFPMDPTGQAIARRG